MSITTYEFLSVLQAQDNVDTAGGKTSFDYLTVLDSVRATIAQSHATELAAALNDEKAAQTLKNLILKYAAECMAGKDYDRDALALRIYQDMAGLGILTKYLYDPSVEEINLNGYNAVEIIRAERTDYLYGTEAFASPIALHTKQTLPVRMPLNRRSAIITEITA